MSETPSELFLSFDPRTIEHLGLRMYSHLPNALAELIANAYDADAENVKVMLFDEDDKAIIVEDDGLGMSYSEVNEKFLRIGRNRREEGETESPKGRKITGRKGLGKLAFFGIGKKITVCTKKYGKKVTFFLNWDELIGTQAGQDYKPSYRIEDCGTTEHGTEIRLSDLKRKSHFDAEGLAISLAKLFNFSASDFAVTLFHNEDFAIEIDSKLKYQGLETDFEWTFPEFLERSSIDYENASDFRGLVMTTVKPLKPGLRGITLFANGRMVNQPEFFGLSESSHFFSYATGWIDADFIDSWEVDVISTNRQSIDWENPATSDLKRVLQELIGEIHRDWRQKRQKKRDVTISENTSINIEKWFRTLPEDIESHVNTVIRRVVDDSELPIDKSSQVIQALYSIVPEYPKYHWRHLHPEIREASENDYKRADYYRAFTEAAKRYIMLTRDKSGSANTSDQSMMGEVYGRTGYISVAGSFQKPDGSEFPVSTLENIEEGQKFLSMGIVAGGRNPVAHEEIAHLRDSGLFSEKDCLDGLSLLSHLIRRLECI